MKTELEMQIRRRLLEKNLSISKLAEELEISRVTIYHLFKGIYSRKLAKKISHKLSIPLELFFYSKDEKKRHRDQHFLFCYHRASPDIQIVVNHLLGTRPLQVYGLPMPDHPMASVQKIPVERKM